MKRENSNSMERKTKDESEEVEEEEHGTKSPEVSENLPGVRFKTHTYICRSSVGEFSVCIAVEFRL